MQTVVVVTILLEYISILLLPAVMCGRSPVLYKPHSYVYYIYILLNKNFLQSSIKKV